MGGLGYDEKRNQKVGGALVQRANYDHTLSIPDPEVTGPKDGVIVHEYNDGSQKELSGKESLDQQGKDGAQVRYSKLHADRARQLIAAIETQGEGPVDAVFQSVDVSTGILAMHERPDLFHKVVLVDPSSIIDLPPRRQFLKEELHDGLLKRMWRGLKGSREVEKFEEPTSRLEKAKRNRKTNANGNMTASYVSSQATMLHEIANSEHAPEISVIASEYDHAYSPKRILQSLVDLNDISNFFVTNMAHGLGGKQARLEQLVEALQQTGYMATTFIERLHFFNGVSEDYQKSLVDSIQERLQK